MRIAQVAPLFESVPPEGYGGTERVVSYLTEELVREGHEVTLFASGDSATAARLVPGYPAALRLNHCEDPMVPHFMMLERVLAEVEDFDIVHFHTDYYHYPFVRRRRFNHVTTLHGRLDLPDLPGLYREYSEMPLVAISEDQRSALAWANWQGTVYHGLPEDLHAFRPKAGDYLAFLGRISKEKRVDLAVEIAERVRMKLRVAAKIDERDQEYVQQVQHLLERPSIEYVGEIGGQEKDAFLGRAYAVLFPIDWPEPFGLVMIEALACGTPVVAFRRGSVPEVIDDGITGFIVEDVDDAVKALPRISTLSRRRCREVFEERFSARRMARDYVAIYERLCQSGSSNGKLTGRRRRLMVKL